MRHEYADDTPKKNEGEASYRSKIVLRGFRVRSGYLFPNVYSDSIYSATMVDASAALSPLSKFVNSATEYYEF